MDNLDYLPFSEQIAGDTGTTHKFTGKERDAETGLDFFGARYFSAAQGRFTSPDWSATPQPIPYADLSHPQTLSLYSYVRNNPLKTADPDGHCEVVCASIIGGSILISGIIYELHHFHKEAQERQAAPDKRTFEAIQNGGTEEDIRASDRAEAQNIAEGAQLAIGQIGVSVDTPESLREVVVNVAGDQAKGAIIDSTAKAGKPNSNGQPQPVQDSSQQSPAQSSGSTSSSGNGGFFQAVKPFFSPPPPPPPPPPPKCSETICGS